MSMTKRRLAAGLAALTVSAGAVLAAAPTASAESWSFPVSTTLSGRSSTNTAAPSIREYSSRVNVTCQIYGSLAYGSYIWDKTTEGVWVTDAYVRTGHDGFVPGIPRCGASDIPTTDPGNNPYGASTSAPGTFTPRARWVKNKIEATFPNASCFTYASTDPASDHHNGNGIDCAIGTVGQWPTLSQGERMLNLAGWVKQNAGPMDVQYVISVARIWNIDRASEGWRLYTAKTGVTGGHYDHVHISVKN
jgi:hypothetical protein